MRSKNSWVSRLLGALAFLVLATPATQASLVYESVNGASLIYDPTTGATWTQNGDISGQLFTQSDAENWAANLSISGLSGYQWRLGSSSEFSSLYTQLDPYGGAGTQDDKYGTTVAFGTGANDYASNVETTYWTSDSDTDFNFFYGYPGGPPTTDTYSAWAVVASISVPEPPSAVLVIAGIAGVGLLGQIRSKKSRLDPGIV